MRSVTRDFQVSPTMHNEPNKGSEVIKYFWVKQSSKYMIFESFSIYFGKFGNKEGIFSNLGQRTMSQIRGAEGIKYFWVKQS